MQSPRFRLISSEKSLSVVRALVRQKKSSLTRAVRPVNAVTHLTFNHLNDESLLASLESPACSGPVTAICVFRAWAQVHKEKSPVLGEILPMRSRPGSPARSILPALHPSVYHRCSHASSGPFSAPSNIWDNNVIVLCVF